MRGRICPKPWQAENRRYGGYRAFLILTDHTLLASGVQGGSVLSGHLSGRLVELRSRKLRILSNMSMIILAPLVTYKRNNVVSDRIPRI